MNGQVNVDFSVIEASGFLGALPAVLLVLIFQKNMVAYASMVGRKPQAGR